MTRLTDAELLDRHRTSLGEARAACQELRRFADPDLIGLKGGHYAALKGALDKLEGSARQLGTIRGDARWIRLGAVYGRARIKVQGMFARQAWKAFGEMGELFLLGQRHLDDLDKSTGRLGDILPQNASRWLWMPSPEPFGRTLRTVH